MTPSQHDLDNALYVVNHSGGKDSQAMMIRLLRTIPARQLLVIHAALGDVEWPGALDLAQKQAEDAGVPFIVARAGKTLFDMAEHRFAVRPQSPCWPSAANRQCTSDLKRGPIERETRRYAAAHGFRIIVACIGIRAQESSARSKQPTWKWNDAQSVAGRKWWSWLPIHGLTRDEVFAEIAGADQQPHWAYAAGNERLSCMFCIMGSRNDLRNAAKHNPALAQRYIEIEQRTGYTMHQSRKSLTELIAED